MKEFDGSPTCVELLVPIFRSCGSRPVGPSPTSTSGARGRATTSPAGRSRSSRRLTRSARCRRSWSRTSRWTLPGRCYEAWVKIQTGLVDTALVYGFGKSSAGQLRRVMSLQMDPYTVTPLWADAVSVAAIQARSGLESGAVGRGADGRGRGALDDRRRGQRQRDPQGRHDGRRRTGPAAVRRPAAPLGLRPGLRRRRRHGHHRRRHRRVRPPARSKGVDHRLRAPHRAGRAQQPRPHGLRRAPSRPAPLPASTGSTSPSCMHRSRTRS